MFMNLGIGKLQRNIQAKAAHLKKKKKKKHYSQWPKGRSKPSFHQQMDE